MFLIYNLHHYSASKKMKNEIYMGFMNSQVVQ